MAGALDSRFLLAKITGSWDFYTGFMDAPKSTLPHLQHVTIMFPPGQERALRDFYQGAMGFREKAVPRVVKPLGWIWFHTAAEGVELHCVPDAEPVSGDSKHHFCVQIDDLEGCRARLQAAGIQVQEARPLPLRPRFFTRDPFNNLIEVVRIEGDYAAAGEAAE